MYCIKMKRAEQEFWDATHRKVFHMIDMYADEANMKAAAIDDCAYESKYFGQSNEVVEISSMRDMEGFV